MARRSAPPHSGPAYYTPATISGGRGQLTNPNESALSTFLREQIFAPEKLPGNINILTGVGVFLGGILFVRRWGDMLIPA